MPQLFHWRTAASAQKKADKMCDHLGLIKFKTFRHVRMHEFYDFAVGPQNTSAANGDMTLFNSQNQRDCDHKGFQPNLPREEVRQVFTTFSCHKGP